MFRERCPKSLLRCFSCRYLRLDANTDLVSCHKDGFEWPGFYRSIFVARHERKQEYMCVHMAEVRSLNCREYRPGRTQIIPLELQPESKVDYKDFIALQTGVYPPHPPPGLGPSVESDNGLTSLSPGNFQIRKNAAKNQGGGDGN